MHPHHRPLALTLGALAVSLGSVGVSSLVAWARCGSGDECSTRLAVSVFALAPASLLLSTMLLLLRIRTPLGRASRALTAASIAVATMPLTAFLLRDPFVIVGSAGLLAVLFFMILSPDDQQLAAERDENRAAAASRSPRARAFAGGDVSTERLRAALVDSRRMDRIARQAAGLVARTSRMQLPARPIDASRIRTQPSRPSASEAAAAPEPTMRSEAVDAPPQPDIEYPDAVLPFRRPAQSRRDGGRHEATS